MLHPPIERRVLRLPSCCFKALKSRIEDRLIIPLDGLDRVVTRVVRRSRPRLGGVDTPSDETEQTKRNVYMSEQAWIDLGRHKLPTALPILCPVLEEPTILLVISDPSPYVE